MMRNRGVDIILGRDLRYIYYNVNKMLRFRYILLLVLAAAAMTAGAQVKISGKVTNEENEPIEFATVRVAGTAIGVNTNLDGDYTINVAKRDTIEIVFNCIGYKELK